MDEFKTLANEKLTAVVKMPLEDFKMPPIDVEYAQMYKFYTAGNIESLEGVARNIYNRNT